MDKVIFMGIHFKEGYEALDSRTRSGKVIDLIIQQVNAKCSKENLFPTTRLPRPWEQREILNGKSFNEKAIYVGLGKKNVCKALSGRVSRLVSVDHPGYALRQGKVKEYVQDAVNQINSLLSQPSIL